MNGAGVMAGLEFERLGFTLIFVGFIIIFLAVLLLAIRGFRAEGTTKGGGVIIIGPIPIVFGSDKHVVRNLLYLALVLVVATIALFLLFRGR